MRTIWLTLILMVALTTPALGAIVYFSDFETDDGGLKGTVDWEWGAYAWHGSVNCSSTYPWEEPPGAYSGTHMWGPILNDCYNNIGNEDGSSSSGCTNTAPADDSILTFTVDLTGVSDAEMSWWEWYDVNSYWDWGEIYANGTVVFQHCESDYIVPTVWVSQTVDLTSYTGKIVTIDIHFLASDVVARAGWYIDDLEISTSGPIATPTPSPTRSGTPPSPTPTLTPAPVPFANTTGLVFVSMAFWISFIILRYRINT